MTNVSYDLVKSMMSCAALFVANSLQKLGTNNRASCLKTALWEKVSSGAAHEKDPGKTPPSVVSRWIQASPVPTAPK